MLPQALLTTLKREEQGGDNVAPRGSGSGGSSEQPAPCHEADTLPQACRAGPRRPLSDMCPSLLRPGGAGMARGPHGWAQHAAACQLAVVVL